MSFGQKQAWNRVPGASNAQLNQNLLANQLGLTGQAFGSMPAISLNSSLNALVNQAAFSNMNMNSVLAQAQAARLLPQNVSTAPQTNRPPANTQSPPPSRNQKTFDGTVTKLMETYGFVNEDVFFQTNVIRGPMPRVGDLVRVEASFNPSMPFKWNAYRIQLLPQIASQDNQQSAISHTPSHQQQHTMQRNQPNPPSYASNNNSAPQRWQNERPRNDPPPRHQSDNRPHVHRSRNDIRRSPPRRSPIRKEAPKRERERSPIRRESHSRDVTRTRSPALSVAASVKRDESPPRRRQRIIPRYRCYKPKPLPSNDSIMYYELHKRYTNLYIPSDFIKCDFSWLNSIQLDTPLQFSPRSITYNVLHKDIDNPSVNESAMAFDNPPDADNRFVVKVLLLSHPGLVMLRQKMHGLLPDGSIDENIEPQSILKHLQLLIGVKNKNEYACLGGAWSPSLDGANALDPQTLINTAVRTTLALTGVDLSACPKWYKMVHLHYYRAERNRIDNVVLMLPDTSSTAFLMPDSEQFKELENKLKVQLTNKLAAVDSEQFVFASSSPNATTAHSTGGGGDRDSSINDEENPTSGIAGDSSQQPTADPTTAATKNDDECNTAASVEAQEPNNATAGGAVTPSEALSAASNVDAGGDSTLGNIKNMKVAELREELEKRGLDSKGVKNVLLQRLQEAIEKDGQKSADESGASKPIAAGEVNVANVKKEILEAMDTTENVEDEAAKLAAEKAEAERLEKEKKAREKFEKDKKERKAALQRHFLLPKEPTVFIYPSKTAKGGKFDCKVVSMDTLLDYRQDVSKESAFEVFIFAEALREALDRGHAFSVYCALEAAQEHSLESERRKNALSEALNENSDEVVVLEDENSEKKKKKEEKKADPRHAFKALVHDVESFCAFAYFDENVSGYIEDRDLEDIVFSVGHDLSRGEVHKLIKKISNRERCNYRNITDKWVDAEGCVKYFATPIENVKSPSELATGRHSESIEKSVTSVSAIASTPDVTNSGIVFYRGSVLNIAKAMEQHSVVEKERTAALIKNDEFEMQLKSAKKQRDHLDKTKKRLEGDLDRYKKKLYEAEKCLKAAQEGSAVFKTALLDCKKYSARIQTAVDKAMPPAVKKEEKKKADDSDEGNKNVLENGDVVEIVLTEEVGNDDVEEKKFNEDLVDSETKEVDNEKGEEADVPMDATEEDQSQKTTTSVDESNDGTVPVVESNTSVVTDENNTTT